MGNIYGYCITIDDTRFEIYDLSVYIVTNLTAGSCRPLNQIGVQSHRVISDESLWA